MSKIIEFSWPTVFEWFWQVLALVIIVLILKKLLFKPVSEFIEKRRQAIADDVNSATNAKKSADELKAEYENKLKHINNEADEILKTARTKALEREGTIIEEAKAEAVAIKEKAKADTALELEKVRAQMKDEMISVATLMASKFVKAELSNQKQEQLIEEIIDEMGDVSWLC